MKPRTRDYEIAWMIGKHVIQYEEGGRTWLERDTEGKVRYFDTQAEAEAAVKLLRPRKREA